LGSLVHAVIIWGWWFTGKKEWEIKFEISIWTAFPAFFHIEITTRIWKVLKILVHGQSPRISRKKSLLICLFWLPESFSVSRLKKLQKAQKIIVSTKAHWKINYKSIKKPTNCQSSSIITPFTSTSHPNDLNKQSGNFSFTFQQMFIHSTST
jgi:hypothetical protein